MKKLTEKESAAYQMGRDGYHAGLQAPAQDAKHIKMMNGSTAKEYIKCGHQWNLGRHAEVIKKYGGK